MLGSSAILTLCILAASPDTSNSNDGPTNVVTREAFQGTPPRSKNVVTREEFQATANHNEAAEAGRAVAEGPKRLPPDPAYDRKDGQVAQKDEGGIPGLPSLSEQPPAAPKAVDEGNGKTSPPKDKSKSSEDAAAKSPPPKAETKPADDPRAILPPKAHTEDAAKPGEAFSSDGDGDPCEVVHGRPHRQSSFHNWLDGIDFDTWLDQGATINTLSPLDRTNGPVTFNNRSNDCQLNQAYFRLKRDVNTQGDCWDVGGRVDVLYGSDSIYTESRGLETNDDFSAKWNAQQYGLALPQLYAEFFAPLGPGIDMKFGHFYSNFGYESVTAPNNFFYSHSYVFQYGEPKTYTGFTGATTFEGFTFTAGMTRGWDNWEDNNEDVSFTGGVAWASGSKRTNVALNVTTGREQLDPSTDFRTLYSLVLQQRLGDRWQYVIQHDGGNEPGAGAGGTNASWYGVNQYLYREINESWKAGMRFEWFHDGNGARVPSAGRTGDYFELTGGVNWSPNTFVVVRPEIRWDWAGTSDLYPYGDGTRSNQLLLDCDVIVRF
jgi:hypothetical protein